MSEPDLYSILGVLPSADAVVIRAAYKALAQRYHPDKWSGPKEEEHRRMSALNEAYRVLGDDALRAEYDRSRAKSGTSTSGSFDDGTKDHEFDEALNEVEGRWQVAVDVYPDLAALRSRLARVSTSLAFTFVTTMLESKLYEHRERIAEHLETGFLELYFGKSKPLVEYARALILAGEKKAAKRLNQLVDVIGGGVSPTVLIDKIEGEFGVQTRMQRAAAQAQDLERIQQLRHDVKVNGYYREAITLAELLGFKVREQNGGLFSSTKLQVRGPGGTTSEFPNPQTFIEWAKQAL